MQNQQITGELHSAAQDHVPIVQEACPKVKGFSELYQELERSISINGMSQSALDNYSRQLAHLALHYDCMPLDLDTEQVMDYLYLVKNRDNASASFFDFTIHGMRYACKMRGLDYAQFALPRIKGPRKLPVVLNGSEVKALLKSCNLLRHKLIIGFCYGCGLRSSEVQHLKQSDVDLERGMVHIHQGKGSKDRCLPLGHLLGHGIKTYLLKEVPDEYLLPNHSGDPMTGAGILWVVKRAAKKAGITKDIHTHTLRQYVE